jgi:glycosyltransferase involved in cell wall biosynthesis
LKEVFGRDSTVIENPIDVAEWDKRLQDSATLPELPDWDRYVLWIGRADAIHKRPQLCLDLAHRCPEVRFLMILNPRDDVVEAEIIRKAPSNVRIVRWIPFTDMPAVYRNAAALVNTSALEGFPNTYLQAALPGVPIGSLEVAEGFLKRSSAGVCTHGDQEQLAQFLREQWENTLTKSQRLNSVARQYVQQHRDATAQTNQLEAVLQQIVEQQ